MFLLFIFYFPVLSLFNSVYSYNSDGVTLAEKTTYAHNYVRNNHAVQNLVWDQTLGDSAQAYANELANQNSFHHSEQSIAGEYGENLYKGFDGFKEEKTIADAVYNWYIEINANGGYDYNNPNPDLEVVGHFTMIVWRTTSKVGCGISSRDLYGGLMTFIVCHYEQPGNVVGYYLLNVMELRFNAVIPTNIRQLTAPIGCIDIYEKCSLWSGVCSQPIFRTIMLTYCKKSCKIC